MNYKKSAVEMDGLLWAQGYRRWVTSPMNPGSKYPHELDYLRGVHNAPTLTVLGSWLSEKSGKNIRLRSMWQDKHVYVQPLDSKGVELERRELADLAVIIQRISKAGVERSMWILQAKVCAKPTSTFSGPSSLKEIELFERTDCFTLLDGKSKPLGKSYYALSFSGPEHWAFLTFHKNHRLMMSGGSSFPAMMRWPGSKAPHAITVNSFCGSLLKACNGTYGASVDHNPEDDEWSRLFSALMVDAGVRKTTGYAKTPGNRTGSVMQLAASLLPGLSAFDSFSSEIANVRNWHQRGLLLWQSYYDSEEVPGSFFRATASQGQWGGGRAPEEADHILISDAFPELPPGGGDVNENDGGENEGPGFQHILFIDVWSEPNDAG